MVFLDLSLVLGIAFFVHSCVCVCVRERERAHSFQPTLHHAHSCKESYVSMTTIVSCIKSRGNIPCESCLPFCRLLSYSAFHGVLPSNDMNIAFHVGYLHVTSNPLSLFLSHNWLSNYMWLDKLLSWRKQKLVSIIWFDVFLMNDGGNKTK